MPPFGLSDQGVFVYLLAIVVLSRMFESLIEIPTASLLPELSRDYDERTGLGSWRYVFLAVIGRGVAVFLTYGLFLRGTKAQPFGQFNQAGYAPLAITGAGLACVTITASALATQRFVPYMHRPPVKRPGFGEMLRE